MQIVYTAPNKGHHYKYAHALYKAGILKKFVSGFSRLSPRSSFPEIDKILYRADFLQTIYLLSLKLKLPTMFCWHIAYLAKKSQDKACKKFVKNSDIFLFYNGSGLSSCKTIQKYGGIGIVEAVNSHVLYQERILKEEYELLGLQWEPFHKAETKRRVDEYNQADFILLPSEFVMKSFLEYGFPKEKLIKIPFGFSNLSSNNYDNNEDLNIKIFRILYVGAISVRKGLRYLIEAFNKLDHPNKELIIVGPMTAPNGLSGLEIGGNITFTGPLKGKDLENAYKSASIFCLPTIEEGLALVLGEALSFGLPIVTTTNSGASDIITDGVEGFILPIRNSNAILEKLQLLSHNESVYRNMRIAAKEKLQKLKGWEDAGNLLVNSLISARNKS